MSKIVVVALILIFAYALTVECEKVAGKKNIEFVVHLQLMKCYITCTTWQGSMTNEIKCKDLGGECRNGCPETIRHLGATATDCAESTNCCIWLFWITNNIQLSWTRYGQWDLFLPNISTHWLMSLYQYQ